ncbi:MAG: iron ABC transporter permease [Acidimicrobiia bacterium]|nr:iron ABC transporter permease [Acidimicrobiia bacterium]
MDRHSPALTLLRRALLSAAAFFFAVFFLWPISTVITRGVFVDGTLDLSPLTKLLSNSGLRRVIVFTFLQASVSTLGALVLGIPGAYAFSRLAFRGRAAVLALLTLPFVLPTVVVGSAFVALLGENGPLGGLHLNGSLAAIVLAQICFNYAVVVRSVGSQWAHIDHSAAQASRTLGAGPARTWLRVTLPSIKPSIVSSALIVFLFCFTSFGLILILGGPGTATIETEIYRATMQSLDLRTAAALSILQILVVGGVILSGMRFGRVDARSPRWRPSGSGLLKLNSNRRLVLTANLFVVALLVGAPLGVLVVRSFTTSSGLGLNWYRSLGELGSTGLAETPLKALSNSLTFAAVATFIAVPLGLTIALAVTAKSGQTRSARVMERAVILPLGVSAVTLGLGYLLTLDTPPLDLRTSWWLIPIAQAIVATPFVVRIAVPIIASTDQRLRDAAALLGARPSRVWRSVDLPVIRSAVATGAGFAFAISLGEFGATAFIVRPETTTLPIAIYRLLGRPGETNFGAAMASAVLLMSATAAILILLDRDSLGSRS